MRKLLIILLILIVLAALWLWRGRDLSMFVDQFKTVTTTSRAIKTITYEGNGTGGTLQADDLTLSLNEVALGGPGPNIGTTKDNQLALSFAGKVFPFGPATGESGKLMVTTPSTDVAGIALRRSPIPWPNFFEVNFMTGNSPKWKRNTYQELDWQKSTGAKLKMVWRYEQFFYQQDHWVEALMTRPGATGLIRIEISDASR